jgi:hypothetical protein
MTTPGHQPMHRLRRLFLWAASLLAGSLIAWYFGPQAVQTYQIRKVILPPGLWATPKPLPLVSTQGRQEQEFSQYGYRFVLPFRGIASLTQGDHSTYINFETGEYIIVFDPDAQGDPLSRAASWEPKTYADGFANRRPPPTRYLQVKVVLSMTPDQLTPLCSHAEFARQRIYLVSKGLWLEHMGQVDILTFQSQEFKGFEITRLPYGQKEVLIMMFDNRDREIQLLILARPGTDSSVTQDQIEQIIQSFRVAAQS